jgi:putative FmdB family regulatory protein
MLYEYGCECGYTEEKEEKIGPSKVRKCPQCKKKTLERLISAPMTFVRREAKTVGQVMERNSKKLGRYEKEHLRKDYIVSGQEAKDKARKDDMNEMARINKMSPAQKAKYIHEG